MFENKRHDPLYLMGDEMVDCETDMVNDMVDCETDYDKIISK